MNIGVFASETMAAGLVDEHRLASPVHTALGLQALPRDEIAGRLHQHAVDACHAAGVALDTIGAIGIGIPGIIRNGIVEDSPNLAQLKGARI